MSANKTPSLRDVQIYFSQKDIPEKDALSFFQFQEKRRWITRKGNSVDNWKAAALKWIGKMQRRNPLLFDRKK